MLELKAQTRTVVGKKNRGLLAKEIAPGSISRSGADTVLVQATQTELIPLMRAPGSEVVMLNVDEKTTYKTVVSELYVNPLSNKVEAFSLTELTPKSHVTVRVPIVTDGVSPAVKNNLGVLITNLPELRITANSENIVDKIVVDISSLADVGARVLVSELPGIEKIKLASEKDRTLTVVTVRPLQKVEVFLKTETDATATPAEGEAAVPAEGEAPAEEEK
jgi:ribosomal protein L25 (general stress protein Ctc)